MVESGRIRAKVEEALRSAEPRPWLFGYDANGIQELITSSSRPIAMRGASDTILQFDRAQIERTGFFFAGGGRGVGLSRSEEEARHLGRELEQRFREITSGGVMATAWVPYDRSAARASLLWLRGKLEIAKDAAAPPGGALPRSRETQCADCASYLAEHVDRRGESQVEVCSRCHAMVQAGRKTGEMSHSLLDVAEDGQLTAISADGNNLGAFFAEMSSLEELAGASEAIGAIFTAAHDDALAGLGERQRIRMVTGGDDLRAFVPPSYLLRYVEALVRGVEERAERAGDLGGLLTPQTAMALRQIGVGVGAVLADVRYPAWRLMGYAHDLERSAKAVCRPRQVTGTGAGYRSAFDFSALLGEEALSKRTDPRKRRPFSMAREAWQQTIRSASALASVPTAQRAVLAEERALEEEEFLNLLRYQVARHKAWQKWYRESGYDWRQPGVIAEHRPHPALVNLLRVLPAKQTEAT